MNLKKSSHLIKVDTKIKGKKGKKEEIEKSDKTMTGKKILK